MKVSAGLREGSSSTPRRRRSRQSSIGEYVINEKAGLDDLGLSCTFATLLSCSDVIDQPCQRNEVKLSVAKIRLGIEALVLMV